MTKNKQSRAKRKALMTSKNRTPVSGHKRVKGQLVTPFNASVNPKNFTNSSWIDTRLPEMLWAVLIMYALGRDEGLDCFRKILSFVAEHARKKELTDLSHTGISELEPSLREELIGFITRLPDVRDVLASLKLFDALPSKNDWDEHLGNCDPDVPMLMGAVGASLWHQSLPATDCRWLRVMAVTLAGKLTFPKSMEEHVEMFFTYPGGSPNNVVAPVIRATEISLDSLRPREAVWPAMFWKQAWENTECIRSTRRNSKYPTDGVVTRQAISDIRDRIERHWFDNQSTTAIDRKYEAVFGITLFALRTLEEMIGIGIGTSILGRLGLRTILEARINLRYLVTVDDSKLWQKWREYGAGQAKLNALRFDEYLAPPEYIDLETIESIASEDIWEECP